MLFARLCGTYHTRKSTYFFLSDDPSCGTHFLLPDSFVSCVSRQLCFAMMDRKKSGEHQSKLQHILFHYYLSCFVHSNHSYRLLLSACLCLCPFFYYYIIRIRSTFLFYNFSPFLRMHMTIFSANSMQMAHNGICSVSVYAFVLLWLFLYCNIHGEKTLYFQYLSSEGCCESL